MRIQNNIHLMYCLNIYKGESWAENFKAIRKEAAEVKKNFCPNEPFALGVRLSGAAVVELKKALPTFKDFLKNNGFYVVSINGFPFGSFHGTVIKEKVYQPDWSTKERVEYTKDLVDILTELLPPDEVGSISTVPLFYGKKENTKCEDNIMEITEYLAIKEGETGKRILLSLEPEPDCYLDDLRSTVKYFHRLFKGSENTKKYIGVCLDCCHSSVEFESPLDWYRMLKANGIKVMKVQISSALKAKLQSREEANEALTPFIDKEYLHQVRIHTGRDLLKFNDLPAALSGFVPGEWRIHFHVPVTWEGEKLSSTTDNLEEEFFALLNADGKKHLELETYTYRIIPGKKLPINESIISELNWLKSKMEQPLRF